MSIIFDYGLISRSLDNLRQPGKRRPDDVEKISTRCPRGCGQKVHGVERVCDLSCMDAVPWPR